MEGRFYPVQFPNQIVGKDRDIQAFSDKLPPERGDEKPLAVRDTLANDGVHAFHGDGGGIDGRSQVEGFPEIDRRSEPEKEASKEAISWWRSTASLATCACRAMFKPRTGQDG